MTPSFTLPLSPETFTDALHKGLGRAMQHARTCGLAGLDPIVIDACLHDHAYDPQCEPERTTWLIDMIFAAKSEHQIVPQILAGFESQTQRYWDKKHRSQIAFELACRGVADARPLVYSSLQKQLDSMDVIGAEAIISLDGPDGLIHVVEYLSTWLDSHPESSVDDYPLCIFDRIHGEGSGRRVLELAAAHSNSITGYLAAIDRMREVADDSEDRGKGGPFVDITNVRFNPRDDYVARMRSIPAAAVIEHIQTDNHEAFSRYSPMGWGKYASKESLDSILVALFAERDTEKIEKFLSVFGYRNLSNYDPRMLRFSEHEDSKVRFFANMALANYTHGDVRALALRKLAEGRFTENQIELFDRNYVLEDAARIEQSISIDPDLNDRHRLITDLVKLYENRLGTESRNLMVFVYEHSPCINCRCNAVEILLKTDTCPLWLTEECRDDSASTIRALFPPTV